MRSPITCFLLTLVFLPFTTIAQQDSVDVFVASQMKQQGITGLSIGIIQHGKLVKAKGYGLANIELNVPVSENTMFKIGSISKQFIAVGIMKLAQDRQLKLSDPMTKFIPDAPATWNAITVRHLLNHTAGFPLDPPHWEGMNNLPDSFYIKIACKDSLAFAPGSKYAYSNFGYFILADIIRIVSHMPFPQYMKRYIFDPGGLNTIRPTSVEAVVPNRAAGYLKTGHDSIINAPDYIALRPGGAFLSDIHDLLTWEMVMQHGKLLTQKNWNQMWMDTINTGITMDNEPIYYGYGWMTNKLNGKQIVHHGGSMPGFRSVYFRYPEDQTAIIILCNSEDADMYGIAFGVSDLLQHDNIKK